MDFTLSVFGNPKFDSVWGFPVLDIFIAQKSHSLKIYI